MRVSVRPAACALILLLVALQSNEPVQGIPFNAITPNLSTGWFHKPGPTESIIFGLVVLKVLALRMAGVFPYNLNELLAEGSYLDNTLSQWRSRNRRDVFFMNSDLRKGGFPQGGFSEFGGGGGFSKAPLRKEVEAVERILLGLRRIDSHDCFIRHVCQVNQNKVAGKSSSYEDDILKIFSLKPKREAAISGQSIWDIYHEALTPNVLDCNQKYRLCPLTKKDMSVPSLLSGLF